MNTRISGLIFAAILAFGTMGISAIQRAGAAPDATARAVAAAEAFLATLDAQQRAKANPPLNGSTRTVWSNLPTGIEMQVGAKERNGIKLAAVTPAQEKAALALLASTLSRDGYDKVMAIVEADQVLEERMGPKRPATSAIRFGRGEFYVSILGKPSPTDKWMIQFGGHHLAINVTLLGRQNLLAPTHTGAQPASYTMAGRTIRPLGDENDKAFALINSLNEQQRKQAILSSDVRNLVLGPGTDGKTIAPEGVPASTFTAAQRGALVELIREWVGILGDAAAAAKMTDIQNGMDRTTFAWAGELENGKGAYFRIHGPTVFIEYAPQGNAPGNTDHIHTIYRDLSNDYGDRSATR